MSKRPAFQFYPADWVNDFNLSMCSLGAQGLWLRLMCYMHQGQPYGHLRVNGRVITPDMLPELVGKQPEVLIPLWDELEQWGVVGKTFDGCYYSRRMVDDEERRQEAVRQGSKGGNPKLKQKDVAPAGITGGLTPAITPPINSSLSLSSLKTNTEEEEEEYLTTGRKLEAFKTWLKANGMDKVAITITLTGSTWERYVIAGFKLATLRLAVTEAANYGASDVPTYVYRILNEWQEAKVFTPQAATAHMESRKGEMERGRTHRPPNADRETPVARTGRERSKVGPETSGRGPEAGNQKRDAYDGISL